MGKGTSKDEAGIKRKDFVEVIGTNDDWESLIGVVDEFMLSDGEIVNKYEPGARAVVYFPLRSGDAYASKLRSVNMLTGLVKQHLQQYEGKQVFDLDQLEVIDPEEL